MITGENMMEEAVIREAFSKAWKTIRLCRDCGMTEFSRGGCYPTNGMECWRPKGVITVWDDEEI